ncbi:MAG: hypothetical protein JW846_06685 [Dehalococcoidia bacterium]|nr:hypothetical protein [Dehalococcoidia bacterium]
MSSWVFLLLMALGVWLMLRRRAKWFFTIAGGVYLAVFIAHLVGERGQPGGGGLASTALLESVVNLYFIECLVLLGLAYYCFKRERRG